MQMYARNFATRGEDIRRQQLARSILGMIADDLRSVVTAQEFDASVLQQQLGSGGGGGAGGGGAGGNTGGGGAGSSAGQSGSAAGGSASTGGGTGTASSTAGTAASGGAEEVVATVREPGLYGTQYELTLDVSRIPRSDEYIPAANAMISSTLVDVPGDIKTVTYFVQSPNLMGVEDSMQVFSEPAAVPGAQTGMTSGLVRRAIDRAVLAYAEEMADSQRLMRTGELLAPEVVSLEFAYFDGTQWVYEWDSSTQSLPWLVQISLGIQSATGEEKAAMDSGVALNTLTYEQQAAYGIQVYDLIVAIPGAQLKAASAADAEADSGMSSMGLP